jgi:hypothetical protein
MCSAGASSVSNFPMPAARKFEDSVSKGGGGIEMAVRPSRSRPIVVGVVVEARARLSLVCLAPLPRYRGGNCELGTGVARLAAGPGNGLLGHTAVS